MCSCHAASSCVWIPHRPRYDLDQLVSYCFFVSVPVLVFTIITTVSIAGPYSMYSGCSRVPRMPVWTPGFTCVIVSGSMYS